MRQMEEQCVIFYDILPSPFFFKRVSALQVHILRFHEDATQVILSSEPAAHFPDHRNLLNGLQLIPTRNAQYDGP